MAAAKTKTHIRLDERAELELWRRKLLSLHTHGIGQVGACAEVIVAQRLANKIDERLNPEPLPDLIQEAKDLIARCSGDWVTEAMAEVE